MSEEERMIREAYTILTQQPSAHWRTAFLVKQMKEYIQAKYIERTTSAQTSSHQS